MNAPLALIESEPSAQVVAMPTQRGPDYLLQVAVESGRDLAYIEKLMDLKERHEASEARKAYNEAFAAFKAEAVAVLKNRKVTDGPLKNKAYAELHAVVSAVTPALSKHGLSASWKLTKDEKDWIEVTCTLRHALGHSECVSMGGPPDSGGAKNAIQARASSISYLERYTLKAICGVAEQDEDNDGGSGFDISGLLVDLGKTTTDAAALAFWQANRDSIKEQKAAYAQFRSAVEAHRAELRRAG